MQIIEEYLEKYSDILNEYRINTQKRLACFFGQAVSEAKDLKPVRESGYYSNISRLRLIFKTPFLNKSDDFVSRYVANSEKCLNYVYSNRMGNGNEESGDGYKYRGGGIFQITGKDNYILMSKSTGFDLVEFPDLILKEEVSLVCALEFWNLNNINKYADSWNIDHVSDLINIGRVTKAYGDANGFDLRKKNCELIMNYLLKK